MPFWMLDDQAPQKGKIKSLTATVLDGDLAGLAAIATWALSGATSQAAGSDGLVGLADIIGIVPDRAIAEQLAHLLVAAGLWHAHGHDCPRCDPVPPNSWRFHDWWDMRYKRSADLKVAQAKSKENKRPEVVNAVWLRDCVDPTAETRRMAAHCRYCGKLTKRSDRTPDGPQLDHVDPTIAAGTSNLVVACGPCNRRKGSKSLAEAGMTLLPAPRALVALHAPADAETTISPATTPALAAAVTPGTPAAVTPAEPTVVQDVEPAVEGAGSGLAPSQPDASPKGPPAGATRGRGPGRAPGSGSGSGVGLGSGEGSGSGLTQPTPRRPRRRRGRGGRPQPAQPDRQPADAGAAPLAWPAPTGGSPWRGWTGPGSPLSDENICPIHHQHAPCDRCARDGRGESR